MKKPPEINTGFFIEKIAAAAHHSPNLFLLFLQSVTERQSRV